MSAIQARQIEGICQAFDDPCISVRTVQGRDVAAVACIPLARIALFVFGGKVPQISSLAQFGGRAVIVRAMQRNPRASKATICTTFSFLNIKGCLEANASFLRRRPKA
jgi:hypothetical protein